MNPVIRWMVPAFALVCLSATPALAQQYPGTGETSYWNKPVRAPGNAFELTIGGGYTQGFGRFAGPRVSVGSVAQEGAAVELGLGYRINPRFSIGVQGQYQEFRPASSLADQPGSVGTRGVAMGINGAYHFMPDVSIDPFLQLATGYRLLWEAHGSGGGPDILRHGLEIARVAVGVDLRASEDVAIAPVIGADVSAFAFQRTAGTNESPNISDWGLSSFLFAGLQGRFDMGGYRQGGETTGTTTVARR